MRILFIGDIIGRPGRRTVREVLPGLLHDLAVDLVLANGENVAGGFGVTPKLVKELIGYDIDLLTSGNHIWDKRDILNFMDGQDTLLRPANFPNGVPGKGGGLVTSKSGITVGVVNVSGRVYMDDIDCPFHRALEEAEKLRVSTPVIVVDFHAEATSEKEALGWYLDGKVSAVVGTHTHVQTADNRVLPQGTAYMTDLGMTGSMDSVIGIKKEIAIERFLTGIPKKFEIRLNRYSPQKTSESSTGETTCVTIAKRTVFSVSCRSRIKSGMTIRHPEM